MNQSQLRQAVRLSRIIGNFKVVFWKAKAGYYVDSILDRYKDISISDSAHSRLSHAIR